MSDVDDQTMEKSEATRTLHGTNSSCLFQHQPHLVDLEERMKELLTSSAAEEDAGDTFAERAEWYYQKRPQLLALLQDMYNGYLTLLDRCEQTKRKCHHRRQSSQKIMVSGNEEEEIEDDCWSGISHFDSEAESSLSYQQPLNTMATGKNILNVDELVADLVMKNVENDILLNQLGEADQVCGESSRKIELLKMLLELLESERVMLLNENVRLGYKVTGLLEEKNAMASEAMFMKKKAAELAGYLLRMRDNYRTCILRQKIEDLQAQIYFLEEKNKEYCQQLVNRDQEMKQTKCSDMKEKSKMSGAHEVTWVGCFQMEALKLKKRNGDSSKRKDVVEKSGIKWWEKVKKMELFMCAFNKNS